MNINLALDKIVKIKEGEYIKNENELVIYPYGESFPYHFNKNSATGPIKNYDGMGIARYDRELVYEGDKYARYCGGVMTSEQIDALLELIIEQKYNIRLKKFEKYINSKNCKKYIINI